MCGPQTWLFRLPASVGKELTVCLPFGPSRAVREAGPDDHLCANAGDGAGAACRGEAERRHG